MTRPRSVTVIMWLAVAQGILLSLVALLWLQIASIFAPESGVTSSIVTMLAMAKGWVLIALALMYFIFAAGSLADQRLGLVGRTAGFADEYSDPGQCPTQRGIGGDCSVLGDCSDHHALLSALFSRETGPDPIVSWVGIR